eukprot:scaffold2979_cov405-Prasinococcus_capsulatus_cf.AAC.8
MSTPPVVPSERSDDDGVRASSTALPRKNLSLKSWKKVRLALNATRAFRGVQDFTVSANEGPLVRRSRAQGCLQRKATAVMAAALPVLIRSGATPVTVLSPQAANSYNCACPYRGQFRRGGAPLSALPGLAAAWISWTT